MGITGLLPQGQSGLSEKLDIRFCFTTTDPLLQRALEYIYRKTCCSLYITEVIKITLNVTAYFSVCRGAPVADSILSEVFRHFVESLKANGGIVSLKRRRSPPSESSPAYLSRCSFDHILRDILLTVQ
jgi:hypothetical protein